MKREWIKDIAAVLLFLMLFPYFAMSFVRQKQDTSPDSYHMLLKASEESGYSVIWEESGTKTEMPMEIFMLGALAGSIKAEYELEALKAQAVVLRSTLCGKYEAQRSKVITVQAAEGCFKSAEQLQGQWKENYSQYNAKCMEAVTSTQGIVMRWRGEAVNGCYHGMSAGKTRMGSELSGAGEFDYLKEADCQLNVGAPAYLQTMRVPVKRVGELVENETDASGYVISVYQNGELTAGEKLRETLGLWSSNFTWKVEKETYLFTTKGIGHGFGYDQFYGNELAKKGENYQDILNYFFADIAFEKMQTK